MVNGNYGEMLRRWDPYHLKQAKRSEASSLHAMIPTDSAENQKQCHDSRAGQKGSKIIIYWPRFVETYKSRCGDMFFGSSRKQIRVNE